MKKVLLLTALLSIPGITFAQIDRSKTTTTVNGLSIPAEKSNSLSSPTSGLSIPKNEGMSPALKDPFYNPDAKKPINLTTDNGLLEFKKEDFTPKAFKKDKEAEDAFKNDQYLGDFKTTGKFVEVYCRDHEYVDGDRVRIFVNGEVVYNNLVLSGGYSPILVKLKTGLNSIEFEALNTGTSGPNTAELKVFDENGQPLTQNEWNLMTGAKAKVIIVKE